MAAPDLAPTLLVVEDDDVLRTRLVRAFRDRGLVVREAAGAEEALELARLDPPEYALVDLRIGPANGLDVVRALVDVDPATRVVVLTGYGSIATALDAVRLGAVDYLTKPSDPDRILAAFERGGGPPETAAVPPAEELSSLARVEWEHINRIVRDCGGNISEAARRLKLHRRTLQRKLANPPHVRRDS